MTKHDPYEVVFTPAARRGTNRLPLPAATAMFEHLTGPVAENPRRLGKQLDSPLDNLLRYDSQSLISPGAGSRCQIPAPLIN